MDVDRGDAMAARGSRTREQVEEDDGIEAAGKPDAHPGARGHHGREARRDVLLEIHATRIVDCPPALSGDVPAAAYRYSAISLNLP